MKNILCLLVFSFLFGVTLHQNPKALNNRYTRTKDLFKLKIDNIVENILHDKWKTEELPCLQKTLNIMQNVKNHTVWATWVWDSMQSPTGVLFGSRNQFGNFDQCINPPWVKTHPALKTQYCFADIILTDKRTALNDDPYTSADLYVASRTKNNLTFNKFTWGLCIPAVCKPDSIKKLAETFLSNSHLRFGNVTISIDACQTYDENTEISYGFYATLAFIGLMIILTLLSTSYYDYRRCPKEGNRGYADIFAKAFSVTENNAKLFKLKEDEIHSLNAIKFLSSCLVIYLHYILICLQIGYKNAISFERVLENWSLCLSFHSDVLVDTYILISGILLMKRMISADKPVTINVVIKRYFRLTYVPMILIMFTTQVLKYLGEGPLMPRILLFEIQACQKNWWANLLTINNYMDFSNSCFLVTWSNSCDFHLTILGTGLYWLYQRNKSLGFKAFCIGSIASLLLPTLLAFWWELSPIHFSNLEKIRNIRESINFPIYLHSHLRSGPYFVGLAIGFLLSVCKPADFKNIPMNFSSMIFILGFTLSIFIYLLGGHLAHSKYNAIVAALYVGTNRSIWAIGIALIIVSCEYGTVPLVSKFLLWPVFGPLSKLSYSMGLTHWLLLIIKTSNTMSPENIYPTWLLIDCLGVITFCCGLSYVLWLLFEAPIDNIVAVTLQKRLLKDEKKEKQSQNGVLNYVKEKIS